MHRVRTLIYYQYFSYYIAKVNIFLFENIQYKY